MAEDSQAPQSPVEEMEDAGVEGQELAVPSCNAGEETPKKEVAAMAVDLPPDGTLPRSKTNKELAEELLQPMRTKKGKFFAPGQQKQVLASGLQQEYNKIKEQRAAAHAGLATLRSKEKKIRRVQSKVARQVRKMTLAEVVAAASIKGMTLQDFKSLEEERPGEPSSSSASGAAPPA